MPPTIPPKPPTPRKNDCPKCNGSGYVPGRGGKVGKCGNCNGTGKVS